MLFLHPCHFCVFLSYLHFPVIPTFSCHACVYVSYLRRQVSSLFDALSCRQESRVCVTLNRTAGFKCFCIYFFSFLFFCFAISSSLSFLRFPVIPTFSCHTYVFLSYLRFPVMLACTCHTCVGRYPVFLTHSAAGRKVEFALHSIGLLGLSVFVFSFLFCFSFFYNASSCRQESRVCITLNRTAGFKCFCI